jgi:hypothetical protein
MQPVVALTVGVILTFLATLAKMKLEISLIKLAKADQEDVWRAYGAIEPSPITWARWSEDRGKLISELRRHPMSEEAKRLDRGLIVARIVYLVGFLPFAHVAFSMIRLSF